MLIIVTLLMRKILHFGEKWRQVGVGAENQEGSVLQSAWKSNAKKKISSATSDFIV